MKLIRGAKQGLDYVIRSWSTRRLSSAIDAEAPLGGPLGFGQGGVLVSELQEDELARLRWFFSETGDSSTLVLTGDHSDLVRGIFEYLAPAVRAYLGEFAYLDGVEWMITEPNQESKSSNWHTDNVGNRLKCFICVEGDGSIPTLVIPGTHGQRGLSTWLLLTLMELPRRIGLRNVRPRKRSIRVAHKEGSIAVFDTSLLHRGGYEVGLRRRVILLLEFSDFRKHDRISGPIGSTSSNTFVMDERLLEIPQFRQLLDPRRLSDCTEPSQIRYGQA